MLDRGFRGRALDGMLDRGGLFGSGRRGMLFLGIAGTAGKSQQYDPCKIEKKEIFHGFNLHC
jgi:hypothetical protein